MKKNVKNLPEFKALIERYKTITLEEIQKAFKYAVNANEAKEALTGFGRSNLCSLCQPIKNVWKCCGCIYGEPIGCMRNNTYRAIRVANTSKSLLSAYRARAEYMETLLK